LIENDDEGVWRDPLMASGDPFITFNWQFLKLGVSVRSGAEIKVVNWRLRIEHDKRHSKLSLAGGGSGGPGCSLAEHENENN
jgi:hypothetical protein